LRLAHWSLFPFLFFCPVCSLIVFFSTLLSGAGIYYGNLVFGSQDSVADKVVDDGKLLAYPNYPTSESKASESLPPLSLVLTEFHFLLLNKKRLFAINQLSEEIVYEENFPEARLSFSFFFPSCLLLPLQFLICLFIRLFVTHRIGVTCAECVPTLAKKPSGPGVIDSSSRLKSFKKTEKCGSSIYRKKNLEKPKRSVCRSLCCFFCPFYVSFFFSFCLS
jgi:hypothetical protein